MKSIIRILATLSIMLTILACGSNGPPSSWEEKPLAYSIKKVHSVFEIENNRSFTFGEFIGVMNLDDDKEPTWQEIDNHNWTLTVTRFNEKSKRKEQMSMRFEQRAIKKGAMDAVLLAEVRMDGEPAPPFIAAILVTQAAQKYLKQNKPQN